MDSVPMPLTFDSTTDILSHILPSLLSNSLLSESMSTTTTSGNPPLLSLHATRKGPKCPFGNASIEFQLVAGACCWLKGNSGFGKTTLATYLAGLSSNSSLNQLDIDAAVTWRNDIPYQERCGVLFQQTTLIDELTVAGNLAIALMHTSSSPATTTITTTTATTIQQQIQHLLESVGLDYHNDANKQIGRAHV